MNDLHIKIAELNLEISEKVSAQEFDSLHELLDKRLRYIEQLMEGLIDKNKIRELVNAVKTQDAEIINKLQMEKNDIGKGLINSKNIKSYVKNS